MSNLLLVWGSVDLHQKGELFIYGMHIFTKAFRLNSTRGASGATERPPRAGCAQPYKAGRARPAALLPPLTPGENSSSLNSGKADEASNAVGHGGQQRHTRSVNHFALMAVPAQATSH